ncbi:DUF2971 domain-containing protein [Sinorhizobium meliloti]|uniref:DUF2971 domain-containing protein n=1 Tax=Rhizobium meliloti TaxID=382 RepID=UPI0013E327E0|nr:DUF2971 domain-containing protein [Sinorhizobium meliloti]
MDFLYKYRSCRSEAEFKDRIVPLLNGQLWYARAAEVNDPFEFRCVVNLHFDPDKTIDAFIIVERFLNPGASKEAAEAKVRAVLRAVPRDQLKLRQWEFSYEMWKQMSSMITMCCLAGTPTSTLLWSHYADGHKGVAIGIDPAGVEEATFPVSYRSAIPSVPPLALVDVSEAIKHELFDLLFLQKAECWSYEKEYRILRHGAVAHAASLPQNAIKRIIFGCAMPADMRSFALEWLEAYAPHITVAFALPSDENTYGLTVVSADQVDLSR